MPVDLTPQEKAALIDLLAGLVESNPFPESERVQELRRILAKLRADTLKPSLMSSSGAVTLGNIKLPMLEVGSRCERRGRLSVANLTERHGADAKLTNVRTVLAGDSPRLGGGSMEQCGVHYPQLVRLWRGEAALG